MVSTRSKSILSGDSSLHNNEDDAKHPEVNSGTAATRKPRVTAARLEAIDEERYQPSHLPTDPSFMDLLASKMFAALQSGRDNNKQTDDHSSSSEEDEDEEDDDNEPADKHIHTTTKSNNNLTWRPSLQLPDPSAKNMNSKRSSGLPTNTTTTTFNLSSLTRVPHPDTKQASKYAKKNNPPPPDNAGRQWYNLPATTITDEVKRDLRTLRLRSTFDPKVFYKKTDSGKFPKYFQMGRVIEGATDFYSGRLTNSQRKRTFTDEIMADPHLNQVRKKRFSKLQKERGKWGRGSRGGRKTDNPRLNKKPSKPRH
jgi:hypothetical protein